MTTTIDQLLDNMTLEEQVSLLAGADFWTTVPVPRLGVPAYKVTDGPNGARGGSFQGGVTTACFPVGIGMGATWNPALVQEAGRALADEALHKGARVLLAPTVNLHRSTLNGRNFECYAEDPWLTGELAVAYIRGLQAGGVAATIKHFVGNESEVERMSMSSDVGERALRELYLLPFEKAVKEAGVWAVMTAYNRINGSFAADHRALVHDVLRGQWGFDGLVMSDWFAEHDTVASITAGLDLEMPGPARQRGALLVKAVQDGRVAAADVRAAACNVLRLAERVNALAQPSITPEQAVDLPERRALIRRLGAEGAVLLKNDGGLLPLAASAQTLALIGPNVDVAQIMGGGSATVNALHRITPRDGITAQTGATLFTAVGADNHRWLPVLRVPMRIEFFASTDLSGQVLLEKTYPSSEQLWVGQVEPGMDSGNFSARATLVYTPLEDGEHAISLASAGLTRCHVDGQLVVDNWTTWQRGETYFTFGSDERIGRCTLRAGVPVTITLAYTTATPEPVPIKALRLGLHKLRGEAELLAAEAAARQAEVAIVFIGLNAEWDCEGLDRPHMQLPHHQNELVKRVVAANPKTVVVLQTGAPVELPWLDSVPAVLQAWYPGQENGHAIADVLFGAAEPGGRLPQTWPRQLADVATSGDTLRYPGKDGHVVYDEGVFIGYRHHQARGIAPLFPFGHGLSYTRFALGSVTTSSLSIEPDGVLAVALPVTNTGSRSGSTVVQLYVADLQASVPRPPQELKRFAKLHIAPGAIAVAHSLIDMRALAFWDEAAGLWRAEAGDFELRIGTSADDIVHRVTITLTGDWTGTP